MRERLYLETMEEVLRLNPKIMVNNNGGSNVMYLPLDKWLKQAPELAAPSSAGTAPADPARGTPRETPSRYERSSRGVVR